MIGARGVRALPIPKARGRVRHESGKMNGAERAYAGHLEGLRVMGLVQWYKFEPVKIRLADKTFYEPDFMVMDKQGLIEFHEVKARWSDGKPGWEDDARVKIKVAAESFPATFKGVHRKENGEWSVEVF